MNSLEKNWNLVREKLGKNRNKGKCKNTKNARFETRNCRKTAKTGFKTAKNTKNKAFAFKNECLFLVEVTGFEFLTYEKLSEIKRKYANLTAQFVPYMTIIRN